MEEEQPREVERVAHGGLTYLQESKRLTMEASRPLRGLLCQVKVGLQASASKRRVSSGVHYSSVIQAG